MQINFRHLTNFTIQLKFVAIILGTLSVTMGAFGISVAFLFYFIVNCVTLAIAGLMFVGTVFDILKNQEEMRKLESKFYTVSGALIIISAFVWLISNDNYWGQDRRILCSVIIGTLLNAPLNFLIGWQLSGFQNPEQFRPMYIFCSCTDHPMKYAENVAPPRYSEAFSSRGKYNESPPIVELPASHSVGSHNFV